MVDIKCVEFAVEHVDGKLIEKLFVVPYHFFWYNNDKVYYAFDTITIKYIMHLI